MKRKSLSLAALQLGWVSGALALVAQSILVVWIGPAAEVPARVDAWQRLLPACAQVILAMGGAAFGGPLVSDKIKSKSRALPVPGAEG